jgi:hypothetical protein
MEVIGQVHGQAALPQVKGSQYPLIRCPGGTRRFGDEMNVLSMSGFEPRFLVGPVLKPCYSTDCAIPAPTTGSLSCKNVKCVGYVLLSFVSNTFNVLSAGGVCFSAAQEAAQKLMFIWN